MSTSLDDLGRRHGVDPEGHTAGRTDPRTWDPRDDHTYEAQYATALAYLKLLSRTKAPNKRPGSGNSYGLKHAAERWGRANGMAPYVCNGALLLAAYELGFLVERDGLNGWLNVTKRSRALVGA